MEGAVLNLYKEGEVTTEKVSPRGGWGEASSSWSCQLGARKAGDPQVHHPRPKGQMEPSPRGRQRGSVGGPSGSPAPS